MPTTRELATSSIRFKSPWASDLALTDDNVVWRAIERSWLVG